MNAEINLVNDREKISVSVCVSACVRMRFGFDIKMRADQQLCKFKEPDRQLPFSLT